jgi:hypothetical protein
LICGGAEDTARLPLTTLELESQGCLEISSRSYNRSNLASLSDSNARIRVSELRMIEDIERLKPELKEHLIMDRE